MNDVPDDFDGSQLNSVDSIKLWLFENQKAILIGAGIILGLVILNKQKVEAAETLPAPKKRPKK
jgi:hypothetical protein